MKLKIIFLAVILFLSGCVNQAQIDKDSFFPLSENLEWTYKYSDSKGEMDAKIIIDKTEIINGEKNYRLNFKLLESSITREWVRWEEDKLVKYKREGLDSESIFDPIQIVLKKVLNENDKWINSQKDYPNLISNITVGKTETLSLPIGKIDAIKLTVTSKADEDTLTITQWFSKGIGMVKQEAYLNNKLANSLELTNYSFR